MEYKFHKNGSYNIHTIKTEKFKNVRMEVVFRNNFNKEDLLNRTILFNTLCDSNSTYKTRRDLLIKREDLYDASIYSTNKRIGGEFVNKVCADLINPKYTKEKSYLKDIVSLVFDLIFAPNLEDGTFSKGVIEEQKTIIKSNLENIKYNPINYAIRKSLKATSKDALFSCFSEIEDLDLVDETSVYKMYQEVLKHDYIDIFIIGDIDFDEVIDLINKYAKFNTIKTHKLNENKKLKPVSKAKTIKEKGNFLQTQLIYVLSLNSKDEMESMYSANLFDSILGNNGLDSILSKYLREDNSLCYSVSSLYQRLDGLLIIATSLDKKDVKLAKKLIEKSLNDIKKGNIPLEIMENAKANIISELVMRQDDLEYLLEEYLMKYLNIMEDANTRIKKYNNVTLDDIKNIASKIKINTIYELESGE